jgi:elongation factor G
MRRPVKRASTAETRLARSKRLRTFALVGHRSAGKTSVGELLLQAGRVTREVGEVDRGTALLDWTSAERRRHQTLEVSTAWFEWGDTFVQLIDTPGAECLEGLRDAALAGCDAVVVTVDERAGIEHGTRSAFAVAAALGLPVLAAVTKLDVAPRERDEAVVAEIAGASGIRAVPLHGGATLDGVPLFDARAEAAHREALAEIVALGDDVLLERYLEDLVLPDDVVAAGLERAFAERRLLPVVFVCPPRRVGAERLLDAISRLVPSPLARTARGHTPIGDPVEVERGGPFLARVLSTHRDDHGAPFHVLRVEAGSDPDREILAGSVPVRVRKWYRLRGPRRASAGALVPGLVVATWDTLPVRAGDTLGDGSCLLDRPPAVPPMTTWALRSGRRRASEQFADAVRAVADADPGLEVGTDPGTGALLLSGADDEHLRLAMERLEAWTGLRAVVELPPVGYRETPATRVGRTEGVHRIEDTDGLASAFAAVFLTLTPIAASAGVRFTDTLGKDEEDVPRAFRAAVEEGAREALKAGPTAGYPVTGAELRLVGGRHDVLSSTDDHFRIAGAHAARAALDRAGTRLLEPWWQLEVTVPADALGEVLADVAVHRGRVHGIDVAGTTARLAVACPYREVRTFARRLKALTSGLGRFQGQPSVLELLPDSLVAEAVEASPHRGQVTLGSGRTRGDASSPPSPRSGRRAGP